MIVSQKRRRSHQFTTGINSNHLLGELPIIPCGPRSIQLCWSKYNFFLQLWSHIPIRYLRNTKNQGLIIWIWTHLDEGLTKSNKKIIQKINFFLWIFLINWTYQTLLRVLRQNEQLLQRPPIQSGNYIYTSVLKEIIKKYTSSTINRIKS